MNTQHATQIVVLGAGYAGLMTALRLAKKTRRDNTAITLVNATDTFVERIRNQQLATNQSLKSHSITRMIRGMGITFVQGRVTALDPDAQHVTVTMAGGIQQMGYDYLVYALGSVVDRDSVPGVRDHAYTLDWQSAQQLSERLPDMVAKQGQLVVIGGGGTGIEAATEFAESYPDLQVTMVTQGELGSTLHDKSRTYIRTAFDKLNIRLIEHANVTAVHADHIEIANHPHIPFDACMWAGGFKAQPLAREAGFTVNAKGQILTDRTMRACNYPNVFVVGDAGIPAENVGAPIRMAVYTALMMGAGGADSLLSVLKGKQPRPFGLSFIAMGISLGRRDCLIQFLKSDDQPRRYILTGRLGVYYKEFFTRFAIWAINAQRTVPSLMAYWPGKFKMKGAPVAPAVERQGQTA